MINSPGLEVVAELVPAKLGERGWGVVKSALRAPTLLSGIPRNRLSAAVPGEYEIDDCPLGLTLALVDEFPMTARALPLGGQPNSSTDLCGGNSLEGLMPFRCPFFLRLALAVQDLLVPIMAAVDRYGLKTWHLRKFEKDVEKFYARQVVGREYTSELAVKYQKRFQRYRESLFTFLGDDGIPWNNNMAERAIRQLAVQRKISGTFFKRVAPQYLLLLLAIAQTCRFQGKSFLKFLLSKTKDVDEFRRSRPIKYSFPVAVQATVLSAATDEGQPLVGNTN